MLLVEDSRIFADLLAGRIRDRPGIAGVDIALTLAQARRLIVRACPDLVILDVCLGDGSGLDLLDDVRGASRPPRVLVLSALETVPGVVAALRSGADGWVVKTASSEALMAAVRDVLAGEMVLSPTMTGPVIRFLLQASRREEGFVAQLSTRQVEVLRCVVAGMSRAECAQQLHISVNTVRTHVQVLLKRAQVHSTLALAAAARAAGVVAWEARPDPAPTRRGSLR